MKSINIPVKASSYIALCNYYNNGSDCNTKYMLTGVVNYKQGNGVAEEIYRGVLAFDLEKVSKYCNNIKEAYLAIYIQKFNAENVVELQVCPNEQTYNTKEVVGFTAPNFSKSVNGAEIHCFNTNQYIKIDIKSLVINWLNGKIPNYGVTLKTFENVLGAIQYGGAGSKHPVVLNIKIDEGEEEYLKYYEEEKIYCEENFESLKDPNLCFEKENCNKVESDSLFSNSEYDGFIKSNILFEEENDNFEEENIYGVKENDRFDEEEQYVEDENDRFDEEEYVEDENDRFDEEEIYVEEGSDTFHEENIYVEEDIFKSNEEEYFNDRLEEDEIPTFYNKKRIDESYLGEEFSGEESSIIPFEKD